MKEIEKLKDMLKKLKAENASLKAENARYREALEAIAAGNLAPSLIKEMYIDQAYQTMAEKAFKLWPKKR